MNGIYYLFTVCDRDKTDDFMSFLHNEIGAPVYANLCYGTAGQTVYDTLGLSSREKIMSMSVITGETWKKIKSGFYDVTGAYRNGSAIAFISPIDGFVGKSQFEFSLGGQRFDYEGERKVSDIEKELIIIISNIGHSDGIMKTAREAGAGGGTVIHAKGTGMGGSEKFFGVSLASEREIILIVASSPERDGIMTAINAEHGVGSKAQSIIFSIPVTDSLGIRFKDLTETKEGNT